MNSKELRKTFLDYFQQHQHTAVASSALIPANDPSLLFTNAGMVQFKDVFLGHEQRPYTRATSSQRCVRAGGKHNDLENVGYTARHHTFFEMLGNFSFGDYFKREAIQFAWTFLTGVLKIPEEKLWITVYKDDDEAADIWLNEMQVDANRFSRCDEDNFWSMGDTGPCGPCSEIFYDHGPEIPGGPPGSADADGDRYIEIWNLVFMQFNRAANGSMTPLPKPSVDTGMGLERIAAVLQGVHSNYEIDIFRHLICAIAELAEIQDLTHTSLRVIADHIRSAAFLITDGIRPSNENRGYVLRRIIRRAIRHGHKLGLREPFFYQLVSPLVKEMGDAYPELSKAQSVVEKILHVEEQQFANTLEQGLKILEQEISGLSHNIIPGHVIFRLYDTYGFPPDLTNDIARERGLKLDYAGFEEEMTKQRQQSQAASQFAVDYTSQLRLEGETEFLGYEHLSSEAVVTGIIQDGKLIDNLNTHEKGAIILNRTPFYAESGGQVGDKGEIYFEGGIFQVHDTHKKGLVYLHYGELKQGQLHIGTKVSAEVNASRGAVMLNHSATHLLHSALRRLLGEHVIQKGSLVEADRLRFDFSHFEPLMRQQIKEVERLVNQQIRANLPSHVELMTPEAAKEKGAMALFGEKYGDEVRVLSMGEFSMELCGGTHVDRTGNIGIFKITTETGIAAGVRRIEGVTGDKALLWIEKTENTLSEVAELLKTNQDDVGSKLNQTLQRSREQEKIIEKLKLELIKLQIDDLLAKAVIINDITVIATQLQHADINILRTTVDQLKQKLVNGVVLLAAVNDDKVQLVAGVTKSVINKLKAGDLVAHVSQQIGGKGGGRPDLAQGGGDKIEALANALANVHEWVIERLK
jgi:alanyl-tRNA synthetase